MAKVYIFLANGYEEVEGLTVVDLLRRAGIETVMVSTTGELFVTGSHLIMSKADMLFEDSNYEDADMLVLPGGMPGTTNLLEHKGLDTLLREFHNKDKKLAAICAAPKVLGNKGILKGVKATCYPGSEEGLIGAHLVNANVVEDGNIITSKAMGTAIDFSLVLIRVLSGKDEAIRIAQSIYYTHND